MRLDYTDKALKVLGKIPMPLCKAFYKQAAFLQQDLQYPSLRAKKFNESNDVWQARVNNDWRFYFLIKNDVYIILDLSKHPK